MSELPEETEKPRRRRPKPHKIPRLLWSVDELSAATGFHRDSIYDMVRQRKIPFVRIGRRVLFRPGDITAWLNSRRVGP